MCNFSVSNDVGGYPYFSFFFSGRSTTSNSKGNGREIISCSCCRDEWVAFTVLHDEMSDRYSKGKDLDPCLASSASKRSVVARPYLRLLLSGQQMSLFLKISSTKVYVSCSLCLNLFFDSHMSGSLVVPLLALDDSQNAPSNRQITHHMCRLLCL